MKFIVFIVYTLILSGCIELRHFPVGVPGEVKQWEKDHKYSYHIFNSCSESSNNNLTNEEVILLKDHNIPYGRIKSIIEKRAPYVANCMYEKGYRFNPELGWCSYSDNKNTYICKNASKYE
ncbi:hypothetical protein [Lonepinella sp. BR2357]|uniref:hypothetical protein n=1 Tax=Lonepinella sp. BR2357 TaxID=3434549 RepID=UPI003F6E2A7B